MYMYIYTYMYNIYIYIYIHTYRVAHMLGAVYSSSHSSIPGWGGVSGRPVVLVVTTKALWILKPNYGVNNGGCDPQLVHGYS